MSAREDEQRICRCCSGIVPAALRFGGAWPCPMDRIARCWISRSAASFSRSAGVHGSGHSETAECHCSAGNEGSARSCSSRRLRRAGAVVAFFLKKRKQQVDGIPCFEGHSLPLAEHNAKELTRIETRLLTRCKADQTIPSPGVGAVASNATPWSWPDASAGDIRR